MLVYPVRYSVLILDHSASSEEKKARTFTCGVCSKVFRLYQSFASHLTGHNLSSEDVTNEIKIALCNSVKGLWLNYIGRFCRQIRLALFGITILCLSA